MIVLDEQICRTPLQTAISRWHPGKVEFLTELRRSSLILDDAVPPLLLQAKQPTFVTVNYKDFWRKIEAHRGYCVVCISLENDDWAEVNPILRETLRLPEFQTKSARMGKVISWRNGKVTYYEK